MRIRLAAILLAAAAATMLSSSALARTEALRAPAGLKPFLLRANEPVAHDFPRTPSFSWAPTRGALRYEFQLAKNVTFTQSSIFWSASKLRGPAVAIPVALPWMTGRPYAAYARVRAVTDRGLTAWSAPFGFNLRWKDLPTQLPGYPGLTRWSTVEGATGYEVWFTKIGAGAGWQKHVTTRTNAVDHREAYAFHDTPAWSGDVRLRVRAVRRDLDVVHLNGLPAVSYGPWSKEFVAHNPALTGAVTPLVAVTNGATSKKGDAREHELTPGFAFSGREAQNNGPGGTYGLYRVYIATDDDCVNVVFKGAITGAPAYAPRTSGPLKLPASSEDLKKAFGMVLPDGQETGTYMAGVVPVTTTEQEQAATEAAPPKSGSKASAPTAAAAAPRAVDLPESGWPAGRFYWTVVPVLVTLNEEDKVEYHELVPAQDRCQNGNVIEFGKDSSPVLAGQGTPYASGLSPTGRLVAAHGNQATFYGHPLVAWRPVQGASGYEVQWSRTRDEWRPRGTITTEGTAAVLPVTPGEWWYRVRARNPYLPGVVKRMAWSTPHRIRVVKPRFAIVGR
jgi:hypothetical protein